MVCLQAVGENGVGCERHVGAERPFDSSIGCDYSLRHHEADGTESAYPVREKVVAFEKPQQASLCGLQTLTTWPSVEVCYMQSEILFDKRMRLRYSIRMKESRARRPYHHD